MLGEGGNYERIQNGLWGTNFCPLQDQRASPGSSGDAKNPCRSYRQGVSA